jgi:hypothetical protein
VGASPGLFVTVKEDAVPLPHELKGVTVTLPEEDPKTILIVFVF